MTRQEHLEWCKFRAFEYCDKGEIENGAISFLSDMSKHDETKNHPAIGLMVIMLGNGGISTETEIRKFIDGFN